MISQKDMMTPLLEACPSFRPAWDEFVAAWSKEDESIPMYEGLPVVPEGTPVYSKDSLPLYLALSTLARHLIDMLARGETQSFPAIFAVVERWHLEGDPYVKNAATVGLLEDIQNSGLHETTTPEQFRPWFGPVSNRWWDKLYDFWERGIILRDD